MNNLDIKNIERQNWNYSIFLNWLSAIDPKSDENDICDFKKEVYKKGKECRKDFAGFANTRGGYIILGVNNDKEIIGIDKSIEVALLLENFLEHNIDPKVNWKIAKKYKIKSNKPRFIYIVKIEETFPFWKKPHISDGIIYIREGPKTRPIKTLSELRTKFFQKTDFLPEDLKYFDVILESFVKANYDIETMDIFIVRLWMGIYYYLEKEVYLGSQKKSLLRKELLSLYKEISKKLQEAKREKARQISMTGMPILSGTQDVTLDEICQEIHQKILIFKQKFIEFVK